MLNSIRDEYISNNIHFYSALDMTNRHTNLGKYFATISKKQNEQCKVHVNCCSISG